jgi:transcriptional regulator with XRE-family HTH domain
MPERDIDREVERMRSLLRTLARVRGLTNCDLERRAGYSVSLLSRLFRGKVELKVRHVLQVCQALGIRPEEFFQLVYPRRSDTTGGGAGTLRAILESFRASEPERGEDC